MVGCGAPPKHVPRRPLFAYSRGFACIANARRVGAVTCVAHVKLGGRGGPRPLFTRAGMPMWMGLPQNVLQRPMSTPVRPLLHWWVSGTFARSVPGGMAAAISASSPTCNELERPADPSSQAATAGGSWQRPRFCRLMVRTARLRHLGRWGIWWEKLAMGHLRLAKASLHPPAGLPHHRWRAGG